MTAAPSSDLVDRAFELMGTHIRILIGAPSSGAGETAEAAADQVEALLNDYNETMSRFRPDSELSKLNRDPRDEVPASEMLRGAVSAASAACHWKPSPTTASSASRARRF
jgi:thiamine biosynthesis lipoprotein